MNRPQEVKLKHIVCWRTQKASKVQSVVGKEGQQKGNSQCFIDSDILVPSCQGMFYGSQKVH